MEQQDTETTVIRIAFDTSVLVDWHKKPVGKVAELQALATIFETKRSGVNARWYFIYLDAVRREIGGQLFERLAKEAEIQDILPGFDQTASLSRFPVIFPVIFVGKEHRKAVENFQSCSVSREDALVLADAVYLKAQFLVTTDMRVIRNEHALQQARRLYGLKVVSPVRFLAEATGQV